MRPRNFLYVCVVVFAGAGLVGCATQPAYDYAELRAASPASILVLPPANDSTEVNATYALLAQMTSPLAEAGYYVVPVALMDATFKENGVYEPEDAQKISLDRLRSIFGADAALYTEITEYGSSYKVLLSETAVSVTGRLIDLRTGKLLWEGKARASSAEQQGYNSGGITGLLVQALVEQVINDVADSSYRYAGIASLRLLSPASGGLLPGPRSPDYGLDESNSIR